LYSVRIIADSISLIGKRITTFELTYPRFVHSELLTHRLLSKNSASSRAIPVKKMLENIRNDPAMPVFWGKNQSGMQAAEELSDVPTIEPESERDQAKRLWLKARDEAVFYAERLMDLGLHKQIANRVTEPWMFITVLCTSTEWENFYNLRDSEFAQPEIAWVAREMKKKHAESKPEPLHDGEWHLPLLTEEDWANDIWQFAYDNKMDGREVCKLVSAGRCARVSYLTHEGKRDLQEDINLALRLSKSGHWSPFEHVAAALPRLSRVGNFIGWKQFRKEFENEHPTKIEAPWEEGSVVLTKEEAQVVRRVMNGSFKLDMEEMRLLNSAQEKLKG
jgi:thymidylate synthase ThyX